MSLRTVVIGGSGHIGSYLLPKLVEAGHEVWNVSRSQRQPYRKDHTWSEVRHCNSDRDADEEFDRKIVELKADIVIDLICYKLSQAQSLVPMLSGNVQHFLHCGTIWVHGDNKQVPTVEEDRREPFGDYGLQKAAIEAYLLNETKRNRFPATILHPGHLVGAEWIPLNPTGNFNPQIYADLAKGNEVAMPNLGRETVHHVHVDDVAQAFLRSIANWSVAVGESFHVVSATAMSLYGYARAVAGWFGQDAKVRFVPWEEWKTLVTSKEADITWGHIARSSNCSIAKAQRLLGYQPRYRSLDAIHEAVFTLIKKGTLKI